MARHPDTLERMRRRVEQLIQDFDHYVDVFDRAALFSGPSLYFHLKTIELRRRMTALEALHSTEFLESVYATLTAWGMHRMGPRGAKMGEFAAMKASFLEQADRIAAMDDLCLWDIEPRDLLGVIERLWEILSHLQIGVGRTKIVAGSKALHHLLPDLLPPIDRQYTLRFFYHHTTLNQGGQRAFGEMVPRFHRIAVSCRAPIAARRGMGMNTSVTKVIDNAIVGYGLEHLVERKPK